MSESHTTQNERWTTHVSTGIEGLDHILSPGLPRDRLYLVDGDPGTGKTTLGMQFLMAGAARGERSLYVTLSETENELRSVARSHGWKLDGVEIYELVPDEEAQETYTLFHPGEIELQQRMETLFSVVRDRAPQRVVFDSLSEMRLLARDALRFRRQIVLLKQFFADRNCTVILLDDKTAPEGDLQLHSLAHGVIVLEHIALEFGAERRRMQVTKLRGQSYHGGFHDFRILKGGIALFPRIQGRVSTDAPPTDNVSSGSEALDTLLGGGITRATSTLITGPAGTGKSVLATQYAVAAARRGENVRFFLFDERCSTFQMRAGALDMPLDAHEGTISVQQIEPTQFSPGEFASIAVRCVQEDNVSLVVIDSINGYMQSMPEERLLPVQVHELLSYLTSNGVTTFMTLVQRGIFGNTTDEMADISYLADTVILLRYFEVHGSVRQAISVVKKRSGHHEHTIREMRIGIGGLVVGEPLQDFQGVLTGVPQYIGAGGPLMDRSEPRE